MDSNNRSEILLRELINRAATCTKKKSIHCYITSQIPEMWEILEQIVKYQFRYSVFKLNEDSHILMFVHNEAEVRLVEIGDPENLQGLRFDWVFIDEFAVENESIELKQFEN